MGETMLRFSMSPKCEVPSRPLVGESALAMYCIMMSRGSKAADEQALPDCGSWAQTIVFVESVGRGAGAASWPSPK